MSYDTGTGEISTLNITQSREETTRKIQELGKSLTVPSGTNEIILNAITESGSRYLREEISLEEAAKATIQEVNLYLSE